MSVRSMKKFDRDFKLSAIRLVLEEKQAVKRVAQDLGVGYSSLQKWLKDYRENGEAECLPGSGRLRPQDEEVRQLREELRLVKMERDFLKKTMGYFVERPK